MLYTEYSTDIVVQAVAGCKKLLRRVLLTDCKHWIGSLVKSFIILETLKMFILNLPNETKRMKLSEILEKVSNEKKKKSSI